MSRPDPPSSLPPLDSSDPVERLTLCMQQLHRLVSDRIMGTLQSSLQGEDVSFTQMTAMYKVRAFAPISVTLLAEHLGVSLPATSQLIQELVRRELMERRENPDNRREKLLALSEKGQQFLSIKERAMVGAYTEVFGGVDAATLIGAEQAITALISQARQLQQAQGVHLQGRSGACPAALHVPALPLSKESPPAPAVRKENV